MDRSMERDLHAWFESATRKPLVLRGARQVGKSTLVRQFAGKRGLVLHEVNLERHLYLDAVFRSTDLVRILAELSGLSGEIQDPRKALLFLDEVQATPQALMALRYFHEDMPQLAVVAAGSLLEFALSEHSFSMPVGRVSFLHLGPVTFAEFLAAADPELSVFHSSWALGDEMPISRHAALLRRQREYLLAGGMPEALQAWLDRGNCTEVQSLQRGILGTYFDDFAKYARHTQLPRVQKVFRGLPGQIGRKVKFANLSRDDRSAEVRAALDALVKARICTLVYHSDSTGVPLGANRDDRVFKALFLDVGLVSVQLGLTLAGLQNLDERSLVNEGPLAEQFVGQELLGAQAKDRSPELYYWLREGKANNAETDFVLGEEMEVIPVEVKSGKTGTLRSLQEFVSVRHPRRALRFDLNPPSVLALPTGQEAVELISLPLYLAGRSLELLFPR